MSVKISSDLYCTSPKDLAATLKDLEAKGYEVKNLREDQDRKASVKDQEKNGWSLWFAHLRDDVLVKKGKCGFCGAYIDVRGVYVHNRKCENCGEIIYKEYVDGATIRFFFFDDLRSHTRDFSRELERQNLNCCT